MTTVFGGSQQSPEQIEALRKQRQDYQDYLVSQQTNTNADVNKKALTPESGAAVLHVIQKAQDWLGKNPNANLNTVLAQRETTNTEIRRILSTDKPKLQLRNLYTMLPVFGEEAVQKKLIQASVVPKLQAVSKETETWYTKHKDTATSIEFDQQQGLFIQRMKEAIVDQQAIDYIQGKLNGIVNQDPDTVEKRRQQDQAAIQKTQDQTINIEKGVGTITATATTVFWTCLLVFLCLMAGSFAANMAIGRIPAYRVLYFVWGAIPFFAPFVLLYTIYRRIRVGRLPMYAVLPISIEPATTRLGRLVWYPFYYVPDEQSVTLYKQFEESLKASATV